MFRQIGPQDDDVIETVYARSARDTRPGKLDLSIGVYRDASGAVPIMRAVREAEQQVLAAERPKSYITPLGNREYLDAVESLVLGTDLRARLRTRLVSAQGPGAGGMLRVGAELIRSLAPEASLWLSEPVWAHQIDFFSRAGVATRAYPYYDAVRRELRFEAMLNAVEQMPGGDVLLVHGCCHNPTGADLSLAQWQALAETLAARGIVPFVDVAYQGFGDGVEADVAGLRLLAERVPEMLIAVSSSKSFGVYRERAGMLSLIIDAQASKANTARYLRDLTRALYFMAPDYGAAIVQRVLEAPALRRLWLEELEAYRQRIKRSRARLAAALSERVPDLDWTYLQAQKGMFSCLPIDEAQRERLMHEHAVYLLHNARLNFAALDESHAERVAEAVSDVLRPANAAASA